MGIEKGAPSTLDLRNARQEVIDKRVRVLQEMYEDEDDVELKEDLKKRLKEARLESIKSLDDTAACMNKAIRSSEKAMEEAQPKAQPKNTTSKS